VPKSSGVATRPVPKYACQTRLTRTRAVVGELRSASHRANVSRVGGASFGSWLEEVAAPQHVRLARLVLRLEHEL
jgi:hypothetical protein